MRHQTWGTSNGSAPNPNSPPRSPTCRPCSTSSATSTTTNAPHRSLARRTPAAAYAARPVARPSSEPADRTHNRVRTDRVDQAGAVTLRVNGRLHHIGIGRHHYRTRVLILAQDHITVIDAATGEVLRDFTLDPTRDYQPTGAPKGPKRKKPRT